MIRHVSRASGESSRCIDSSPFRWRLALIVDKANLLGRRHGLEKSAHRELIGFPGHNKTMVGLGMREKRGPDAVQRIRADAQNCGNGVEMCGREF